MSSSINQLTGQLTSLLVDRPVNWKQLCPGPYDLFVLLGFFYPWNSTITRMIFCFHMSHCIWAGQTRLVWMGVWVANFLVSFSASWQWFLVIQVQQWNIGGKGQYQYKLRVTVILCSFSIFPLLFLVECMVGFEPKELLIRGWDFRQESKVIFFS